MVKIFLSELGIGIIYFLLASRQIREVHIDGLLDFLTSQR